VLQVGAVLAGIQVSRDIRARVGEAAIQATQATQAKAAHQVIQARAEQKAFQVGVESAGHRVLQVLQAGVDIQA
jgi:hypothetical protein